MHRLSILLQRIAKLIAWLWALFLPTSKTTSTRGRHHPKSHSGHGVKAAVPVGDADINDALKNTANAQLRQHQEALSAQQQRDTLTAQKGGSEQAAHVRASDLTRLNTAQIADSTAALDQALNLALNQKLQTQQASIRDNTAAQRNARPTPTIIQKSATDEHIFSPESLRHFTTVEIAAIAPHDFAVFNARQLGVLNEPQVHAITPAQAHELSARQVALLGNKVAALNDQALASLDPTQVHGISATHVQALKSEQITALGSSLTGLNDEALGSLNTTQVQAISRTQAAALKPEQVGALKEHVADLKPEAMAALAAAQIKAIDAKDFAKLGTQQLGQLTNEQRKAITSEQRKALDPKQTKALESSRAPRASKQAAPTPQFAKILQHSKEHHEEDAPAAPKKVRQRPGMERRRYED